VQRVEELGAADRSSGVHQNRLVRMEKVRVDVEGTEPGNLDGVSDSGDVANLVSVHVDPPR
jgi:hypothetical protein